MTWKSFFVSSIGKKFTMGLTGLFLITFLVVHCFLNAMIFFNDDGETFNHWAHFMGSNLIIRTAEIGLFLFLILHIVQGLILWKQNSEARPIGYHSNKPEKNSTWYSRSMGILGTLLLLFLIMHISHFFIGTKVALYGSGDGDHHLFEEMKLVFSVWYIVVAYMLGLIALFWHLLHGFQSAFQSFGLNHKRYTPIIKAAGAGYSIIICILFALMPLGIYFGWII